MPMATLYFYFKLVHHDLRSDRVVQHYSLCISSPIMSAGDINRMNALVVTLTALTSQVTQGVRIPMTQALLDLAAGAHNMTMKANLNTEKTIGLYKKIQGLQGTIAEQAAEIKSLKACK